MAETKSIVRETPNLELDRGKTDQIDHPNLLAVKGVSRPDNVPTGNPFFDLVREWVTSRKKFQKGTYKNEFFKFMANSGIGQMGRGLGGKQVMDINQYRINIPSSELSSPVYAG